MKSVSAFSFAESPKQTTRLCSLRRLGTTRLSAPSEGSSALAAVVGQRGDSPV